MRKFLRICLIATLVMTSCSRTVEDLKDEEFMEIRVRTTIDYSMSPEQLIDAGRLDFGIVAPIFQEPKGGEGKITRDVILLDCVSCRSGSGLFLRKPSDYFDLEKVLEWMRQNHYRPGTAHELLAFATTDEYRKEGRSITALGSKMTDWHNKDPQFLEITSGHIFSRETDKRFSGGDWFIAFEQPPDTFKFYHEELHP